MRSVAYPFAWDPLFFLFPVDPKQTLAQEGGIRALLKLRAVMPEDVGALGGPRNGHRRGEDGPLHLSAHLQ